MVHDNKCDSGGWLCDDEIYHQYDLRITTPISGYLVPDNKYGVVSDGYIINYYVVASATAATWEATWTTAYCRGDRRLDMAGDPKIIIDVCYGNDVVPPDARPASGLRPMVTGTPTYVGNLPLCGFPLLEDRLTFEPEQDPMNWGVHSGVGVISIAEELRSSDEMLYVICGIFSPHGVMYPTYGMFAAPAVDTTARMVVVNSILF
jgi:hypothetical protein